MSYWGFSFEHKNRKFIKKKTSATYYWCYIYAITGGDGGGNLMKKEINNQRVYLKVVSFEDRRIICFVVSFWFLVLVVTICYYFIYIHKNGING